MKMVLTKTITRAFALLVAGLVLRAEISSAVDQSVHLERNLFTTGYTDGDECPDEAAVCDADDVCVACMVSYNDVFSECHESLSASYTCDEAEEALCCTAQGCTDNDAFVDYAGCINSGFVCGTIDFSECEDTEREDSSSAPHGTMGGAMTTVGAILLANAAALNLARL